MTMVSNSVHRGRSRAQSGASADVTSTLTDLSHTMAAGAFPTRGLAVRAAALATVDRFRGPLLGLGDGQFPRAARLWLQIASYVEHDEEEFLAALRLSAQCATLGGNASFARNCLRRVAAAEQERGSGPSTIDVA